MRTFSPRFLYAAQAFAPIMERKNERKAYVRFHSIEICRFAQNASVFFAGSVKIAVFLKEGGEKQ
jgi:hypothetical protein